MRFLCNVEAMNLTNLFGDCHDLSTTRGGGLSVLRLGKKLADALGIVKDDVIVRSASQGLFYLEAASTEEAESRIREELSRLPLLPYATVFVAVEEDAGPERYVTTRQRLRTSLRWQQMQAPSVVYPPLGERQVCVIDRLRPGKSRNDVPADKRIQSDYTYERRSHGRKAKVDLIREVSKNDDLSVHVVNDLQELAAGGPELGNLRDKIAVLRFDGNDFGKKIGATQTPSEHRNLSQRIQSVQEEFFRKLLLDSQGRIHDRWLTADGKLRLEILVYGGDEVCFITPAWLGWTSLLAFYQHLEAQPEEMQDVTYSGAIVFCQHKTPIHSVRNLVSELVDETKQLTTRWAGTKGNYAVCHVLETFDNVGQDIESFLAKRYAFTSDGQGVYFSAQDIASLHNEMSQFRAVLSRRKLHQVVSRLVRKVPTDGAKAITEVTESRDPEGVRVHAALQNLHRNLGNAAFLHILELWDYAGIDADIEEHA